MFDKFQFEYPDECGLSSATLRMENVCMLSNQ